MLLQLFASLGLFGLIIIVGEQLAKIGLNAFISRKVSHVLCAILTSLLPYFISFDTFIFLELSLIFLTLITRQLKVFKQIERNERRNYGTTFFPIGALITGLVFFQSSPIVFTASLLILGFSDALAALVGKYYGKYNFKVLSAHKTLEGSTAFVAVTFLIFITTYMLKYDNVTLLFSYKIFLLFLFAIIVAITEAISEKGIDNIFIPLSAALLFSLVI